MTVASQNRIAGPYTGTGLVSAYPFSFKVFTAADLRVVRADLSGVESDLALSADYTVALNLDQNAAPGGVVTLLSPLASGFELTITSELSITQGTSITNGGGFYPKVIEDALDRLTILMQEQGFVSRQQFLRVVDVSGVSAIPQPAAERANKLLSFDASGNPTVVAIDAQSATQLQFDLASPAISKGASLIGTTSGRNVQQRLDDFVNVLDKGADPTGATESNAAIQLAIAAANGGILVINAGTYLIGSAGLDFSAFSGAVMCYGKLKAKPFVAVNDIVNFGAAHNIVWFGGEIDFSQTSSIVESNPRSDHGFYMRDARDIKIYGVEFTNIRFGEVIYIDGTSSISPTAAHGSKRIKVSNCNCNAFTTSGTDVGAAVYIRSDFYTGDGGGIYQAATNGMKVADYLLDPAVAYLRTTTDIQFDNCRFENFDRFGLFNCARVTLTNLQLPSNYTRGLSASPSCEDIVWDGGIVSGNAAHINANYACKRLVFSNLIAAGEYASAGQRHTLRCGFGSEDITFSNITGFGNDVRHIFIEGARNVKFIGVNLHNCQIGNTTVAVSIAGGGAANTSSWVTDKISFVNCSLESNYSLKFDDNSGTATVADGAVTFDESCRFNFSVGFINGTNAPTKYKYYGSGTFTPQLVFSTSGGGAANTYTLQAGWYTVRNGRCFVEGAVTISAKDASGVGNAQISGLPFASVSTANRTAALAISAWGGVSMPANYTYMGAQISPNTSRVSLLRSGSAGVAAGNVAFSEVGAAFAIIFSGEYPIA